MGKTLKYVKDFDFSSAGKTVGYCGGGMKKGYAEGGKADIAQDKAMIRTAVHKHEKSMHPGKPMTKLAKGGKMQPAMSAMARKEIMATPTMEKKEVVQRETVKAPAAPLEMLRDNSKLGIEGNKNPGIRRKSVPVAPRQPMIAPYKSGGLMSDKGAKKVEKVMGEFKAGELHSGSKTGPMVKNPKQAVAIALSEARNVGKKKK
jgi:hypothetical protein